MTIKNLPAIPPLSPGQGKNPTAEAMRQLLLIWKGESGNKLDQVVTRRDLLASGIGKLGAGGVLVPDGEYIPPPPTYVTVLSNLTANGGFGMIFLDWDGTNQLAYAHTEIWRSADDNLSNAILLGTSIASLYVDHNVDSGEGFFYWVRAISTTGNVGPFNATEGVYGEAVLSPDYIIDLIEGMIDEDSLALELLTPIQAIPGIQEILAGYAITIPDIQEYLAELQITIPDMSAVLADLNERVPLLEGADDIIDGRLDEIDGKIAAYRNVPAFDSSISYQAGAIVRYAGSTWRVLQNMTAPSPIPAEGVYWTDVGDYATYDGIISAHSQGIDDLVIHAGEVDGAISAGAMKVTLLESSLSTVLSVDFSPSTALTLNSVFKHGASYYRVILVPPSLPNPTPPNATYYELLPDYQPLNVLAEATATALDLLDERVVLTEDGITAQANKTTLLEADISTVLDVPFDPLKVFPLNSVFKYLDDYYQVILVQPNPTVGTPNVTPPNATYYTLLPGFQTLNAKALAFSDLSVRVDVAEGEISAQADRLDVLEASIDDIIVPEFSASTTYAIDDMFKHGGVFYRVIATQTPPNVTPPNATYYEPDPDYQSIPALVAANSLAISNMAIDVSANEDAITAGASRVALLRSTVSAVVDHTFDEDEEMPLNFTFKFGSDYYRVIALQTPPNVEPPNATYYTLLSGFSPLDVRTTANASALELLDDRVTIEEGKSTAQAGKVTLLQVGLSEVFEVPFGATTEFALGSVFRHGTNYYRVIVVQPNPTVETPNATPPNATYYLLLPDYAPLDVRTEANAIAYDSLDGRVTIEEGKSTAQSTRVTLLEASLSTVIDTPFSTTAAYIVGAIFKYGSDYYEVIAVPPSLPNPTPPNATYYQLLADYQPLMVRADATASALDLLDDRVTIEEGKTIAQASKVSLLEAGLSTVVEVLFDEDVDYALNSIFKHGGNYYRVIATQTPPNETPPNATYYLLLPDYEPLELRANATSSALALLDSRVEDVEGELSSQSELLTILNNSVGYGDITFDAAEVWNFDESAELWTATNASLVWLSGGVLRQSITQGQTSRLTSPAGLEVDGNTNYLIRARIKRNTNGANSLRAYFTTSGHGFSASYYKDTSLPAGYVNGTWVSVEWNMTALTAGGANWIDSVITAIGLDLNRTQETPAQAFNTVTAYEVGDVFLHSGTYYEVIAEQETPNATPPNTTYYTAKEPGYQPLQFEIDWVSIGRPGPGGSTRAIKRLFSESVSTNDSISAIDYDMTYLESTLRTVKVPNFDANRNYRIDNRFKHGSDYYRVIATQAQPNFAPPNATYYELLTGFTPLDADVTANAQALELLDNRVYAVENGVTAHSSKLVKLEADLSSVIDQEFDAERFYVLGEIFLWDGDYYEVIALQPEPQPDATPTPILNAVPPHNGFYELREDFKTLQARAESFDLLESDVRLIEGQLSAQSTRLSVIGASLNDVVVFPFNASADYVIGDMFSTEFADIKTYYRVTALQTTPQNATPPNPAYYVVVPDFVPLQAVVEDKAEASVVAGLNGTVSNILAQRTIKLDVNGRVSGIGLMNDGVTSKFIVASDAVYFIDPGQSVTPFNPAINYTSLAALRSTQLVFGYARVEGQYRFVINAPAYIQNGAITTAQIANATITQAQISNLLVNSAQIADAAITSAKIAGTIQSDNFQSGSAGWRINRSGHAEFNDIVVNQDAWVNTLHIAGNAVTVTQVATAADSSGGVGSTPLSFSFSHGHNETLPIIVYFTGMPGGNGSSTSLILNVNGSPFMGLYSMYSYPYQTISKVLDVPPGGVTFSVVAGGFGGTTLVTWTGLSVSAFGAKR